MEEHHPPSANNGSSFAMYTFVWSIFSPRVYGYWKGVARSLLSEKESIFLCLCVHSQLIQFNVRKTAQLRAERHISKTYGPACACTHACSGCVSSAESKCGLTGDLSQMLLLLSFAAGLPARILHVHTGCICNRSKSNCIPEICRWNNDLIWNEIWYPSATPDFLITDGVTLDHMTDSLSISLFLPVQTHTNKHITHTQPFQ